MDIVPGHCPIFTILFFILVINCVFVIKRKSLSWLCVTRIVGTQNKLVLVLLHESEESFLRLLEEKVSFTVQVAVRGRGGREGDGRVVRLLLLYLYKATLLFYTFKLRYVEVSHRLFIREKYVREGEEEGRREIE